MNRSTMNGGEEIVDPFDVFGESDDDTIDGIEGDKGIQIEVSGNSMSVARSLVEAANYKISLGDNESTREVTPKIVTSSPQNTDDADLLDRQTKDLTMLNSWKNAWPAPLYKGVIILVSPLPVGGGRGYIATESIPPGTLVLVESPMITWPEEQIGKELGIVSVKHLIEHPNANQFVHDLEEFHPTKEKVSLHYQNGKNTFEEGSEEREQISNMIDLLLLEHSSSTEGNSDRQHDHKAQELFNVVELSRRLGIRSRDGSVLNKIDVIRLLLVLRYNGLESGVYRHVAMLNHNDHPNCAKLKPTGESPFSEVRTTRLVRKGEALTISYLPRVVSHASRRKILWKQHRFDIGVKHLKRDQYNMELIGNSLPPSPINGGFDDQSLTDRIERTTEDLERIHFEIESADPKDCLENFETAKALEQTLLELRTTSIAQLQNPTHILLIPILNLHIEICAFVLKDNSLTNSNRFGVLARMTLSGYKLMPLLQSLLGPDHFTLARTSLDLADSISQLLSRSPQKLYDLKLPSMNTFSHWSELERKTRKEHNRIKALYPRDIGKHIKI